MGKRMGRRPMNAEDRRDRAFAVKVTAAEYARIQRFAEPLGMSMSSVGRTMMLAVLDNPQVLRALIKGDWQ